MHSLTVLSALAGASLALAQPLEAPAAQITTAPDARLVKPALALARRQGESKECSSKADEIWSAQPDLAISDSLALWMMSQAEQFETVSIDDPKYIDGVCSLAYQTSVDAPASIASAYSSFVSASASWASKVKPTVTSLAQSCGGALSAGLELVLATDYDSCTSLYEAYLDAALAPTSSGSGASNTGVSPSESNTSSGPAETGAPTNDNDSDNADGADESTDGETTSTSTGAAPRETGFAVAAAAVVAVAGAMVAL